VPASGLRAPGTPGRGYAPGPQKIYAIQRAWPVVMPVGADALVIRCGGRMFGLPVGLSAIGYRLWIGAARPVPASGGDRAPGTPGRGYAPGPQRERDAVGRPVVMPVGADALVIRCGGRMFGLPVGLSAIGYRLWIGAARPVPASGGDRAPGTPLSGVGFSRIAS
jgi:hypothetical protein